MRFQRVGDRSECGFEVNGWGWGYVKGKRMKAVDIGYMGWIEWMIVANFYPKTVKSNFLINKNKYSEITSI